MERDFKFAVEDIQKINLEDYDEDEFSIARLGFLSNAKNAHGLKISEKVLRESAKTVLGKWIVADMTRGIDAGTHTKDQKIVGRIPKEQQVEFTTDENGDVRAYVDAVISKIYAKDYCRIFENDNERAVSVEMRVYSDEDDEDLVTAFNILAVSTLGHDYKPSCPNSNITLTRFSEDDADKFFTKVQSHRLTALEKFAEERKRSMAEKEKYVSHPINTSKEAVYDGAWDGDKAKQDLVKEKDFAKLAPKVCMRLEDGWENREITKCDYPVMMLHDGEWVYSLKGLASALSYAKKENETSVIKKIEKIRKKLGLDDAEGKEENMSKEIEFSAVDIGDMWSRLYTAMRNIREWEYGIHGIYEEDNKKFAIIFDEDKRLYRLDFSLTEEGIVLADEIVEVEAEFIETDNIKRFAEPENVEDYRHCKFEEKTDDVEKLKEEISRLMADIEKRDNIIMEKETKMGEMEKELGELREYKNACEQKELAIFVETLMSEVKDCMNEDKYKEFRDEGLACKMEALDGWSNKVKAFCFESGVKPSKKKDDSIFSFSVGSEMINKKDSTVWDRIRNLK